MQNSLRHLGQLFLALYFDCIFHTYKCKTLYNLHKTVIWISCSGAVDSWQY